MENVYKVRTVVQHIATGDIFRVIARRGMFNCHYSLKLIHTQSKVYSIGDKTDWLSGMNIETYYRVLNKDTVKVLFGSTKIQNRRRYYRQQFKQSPSNGD